MCRTIFTDTLAPAALNGTNDLHFAYKCWNSSSLGNRTLCQRKPSSTSLASPTAANSKCASPPTVSSALSVPSSFLLLSSDLTAACKDSSCARASSSCRVERAGHLATWVSHEDAGRSAQVWHRSSEQEKLLPLPTCQEPDCGTESYFVHEKEEGAGDCPYHRNCRRRPLSAHRQR